MPFTPGPLIDLFCGIGGISSGFRNAGWTPVAGVDSDVRLVESYLANFPGAEGIVGDVSSEGMRRRLVEDYGVGGRRIPGDDPGRRLSAVVGGPPCVGLSEANRGRSTENEVNKLPFDFVRLAVSLQPDLIVMEQSKNLATLKTPDGDSLADRLAARLRRSGYSPTVAVMSAEDYGVPQTRKRAIIVACRRRNAPLSRGLSSTPSGLPGLLGCFPPRPTTQGKHPPAGSVLRPPFTGDVLSGRDLEMVRKRDGMSKLEVGRMNWFPRRAHTSMDLTRPSPTLRTYVHTAAGPFTLHDRRRGTYHKMGIKEMLQLQTFPSRYKVPDSKTAARTGIGNAVPVRLSEAVARGLAGLHPR